MSKEKIVLAPKKRLTEAEKVARSKESVFYDYTPKKKKVQKKQDNGRMYFFDRLSESAEGSMHFESCLELAKQYAEKNGLVFDSTEYTDGGDFFLETVTGSDVSSYREASEAMAKSLAENDVSQVVIYALERLGRTATHINLYFNIFEKYNIKVVFLDGKFDNIDFKTPMGKMMLSFMTFMAEMEAHNISTRVKRSMNHNAKLGFETGGYAPFGMTKKQVQTNFREKPFTILTPDTELIPGFEISRSELVVQAAEKYVAGTGFKAIAKWFNELNIPTSETIRLTNKAKKMSQEVEIAELHWAEKTVKNIILNPKLAGYRTIGEKSKFSEDGRIEPEIFIQNDGTALRTYEPVYTDELWEKILAKKKNSVAYAQKGNTSILRGIIFCDKCGGRMHKGGSAKRSSYVCGNGEVGRCSSNNIRTEGVEDIVKAVFASLLEDKEIQKEYIDNFTAKKDTTEDAELKEYYLQKMGELKTRMNKIQELYLNGVYVGGIKAYKQDIAMLELEMEKYKTPTAEKVLDANPFEAIASLTAEEVFNTLSNTEINQILHGIIERVEIKPTSSLEKNINSRKLNSMGMKCDPARVKVELKR